MEKFKAFLRRKDIEISIKRYGIDALGAMAQGLFCSLLIGTIINTLGTQFHISFLTTAVATVNDTQYTVGSLASAMSGPAMAVAIGYALHCPPLVLFSLITVGFASNALGGAGGPLAVLFVAIFASEIGKAVSKETKIDILVTPLVTIGVGVALSAWWAPALGSAAMKVGNIIMWATNLQPFLMGILVSVFVGIALTLPISSAAICAALGLTGQRVGIVSGQCGKTGSGLFACCQRGSRHGLRGCSRRGGAGRADTESLLEPGRKITAQNGAARSAAAGKRQRCSGSTGKTENGTTSELHTKNLLLKTVSVWPGRTPVPEKADGCSTAGQKTRRGADGFDLIVTILAGFVKRKLSG